MDASNQHSSSSIATLEFSGHSIDVRQALLRRASHRWEAALEDQTTIKLGLDVDAFAWLYLVRVINGLVDWRLCRAWQPIATSMFIVIDYILPKKDNLLGGSIWRFARVCAHISIQSPSRALSDHISQKMHDLMLSNDSRSMEIDWDVLTLYSTDIANPYSEPSEHRRAPKDCRCHMKNRLYAWEESCDAEHFSLRKELLRSGYTNASAIVSALNQMDLESDGPICRTLAKIIHPSRAISQIDNLIWHEDPWTLTDAWVEWLGTNWGVILAYLTRSMIKTLIQDQRAMRVRFQLAIDWLDYHGSEASPGTGELPLDWRQCPSNLLRECGEVPEFFPGRLTVRKIFRGQDLEKCFLDADQLFTQKGTRVTRWDYRSGRAISSVDVGGYVSIKTRIVGNASILTYCPDTCVPLAARVWELDTGTHRDLVKPDSKTHLGYALIPNYIACVRKTSIEIWRKYSWKDDFRYSFSLGVGIGFDHHQLEFLGSSLFICRFKSDPGHVTTIEQWNMSTRRFIRWWRVPADNSVRFDSMSITSGFIIFRQKETQGLRKKIWVFELNSNSVLPSREIIHEGAHSYAASRNHIVTLAQTELRVWHLGSGALETSMINESIPKWTHVAFDRQEIILVNDVEEFIHASTEHVQYLAGSASTKLKDMSLVSANKLSPDSAASSKSLELHNSSSNQPPLKFSALIKWHSASLSFHQILHCRT